MKKAGQFDEASIDKCALSYWLHRLCPIDEGSDSDARHMENTLCSIHS